MTRHKLMKNVGPRITLHFFAACDRRATARYPTATRSSARAAIDLAASRSRSGFIASMGVTTTLHKPLVTTAAAMPETCVPI